ncbi:MAG: ATP-binding protein [Actinomycetota bacterium]|nr:ATP-binding protein [Actinomycetota bacterium]
MSLRVRLSLVVAVAVAALVALGGSLFLNQLRAGLDAALDSGLRARADAMLQRQEADGGANFQDPGAGGLLPPKEALAQVVDGRGAVVDSSEGAAGGPLLTPQQLSRARRGPLSVTSEGTGGGVRLLAVPVPRTGHPPRVLVVGTGRNLPSEALNRVRWALLVGGPLGVGLSGIGAWFLAGAALRPVERMRSEAEVLTARDPEARLAVPGTHDEVARLGRTLNALLDRLHRALAQQRDFVADAGHELRTPLALLRTELELARRPDRTKQELIDAVGHAARDTERLIRLAEDLLLLARADDVAAPLHLEPVRLDAVVKDALNAVEPRAAGENVQLLDLSSPVIVEADRDRLRQIVDNLLDNALRFAPPRSVITVEVSTASGRPERVVLQISDRGPGFPPEFLPHAFERFRRGDAARNARDGGSGLGLSIVAALARAHGGTVTAANQPTGGACVRVELSTLGADELDQM